MRRSDSAPSRSPYQAVERARRGRIIASVATLAFYFSIGLDAVVGILLVLDYSTQLLYAWLILLPSPFVNLLVRRLGHDGRTDLAGYLFLAYYMIVIGVNTSTIGGLSPILAPGLLLLVGIAGLILPPLHSFVVAAIASGVFIAGLAVLYSGTQVASLSLPLAEVFVAVMVIAALSFMALISQLVTSDLRKALDEATYDLVEANRKLAQASDMKSQFTARTSHELRTPLSSIIAFTDLALRDSYGPLAPKLRNALTYVFNSSRHLKDIINDLLDLSKIEAGQLQMVDEVVSIPKLVESVVGIAAPIAAEKGLKWSISVSPDMPHEFRGDSSRLEQIILNLTGNALKYTEKGSVSMSIDRVASDRWRVEVRDSGVGIPEDQLESIFQAYRQLDGTASPSKVKGTGLGLAITRHLVRLMGGTIHVQSTLGRGSTFTVELPLKLNGSAA